MAAFRQQRGTDGGGGDHREALYRRLAGLIETHAGLASESLQVEFAVTTNITLSDEHNGQVIHSDLVSNDHYFYTALLYLSAAGDHFGAGGATLFVDEATAGATASSTTATTTATTTMPSSQPPLPKGHEQQQQRLGEGETRELLVQRGVAVEPRVGRVAIFSGGLENLHGRAPITGWGVRTLMQVWFSCRHPEGSHTARSRGSPQQGGARGAKGRGKGKEA